MNPNLTTLGVMQTAAVRLKWAMADYEGGQIASVYWLSTARSWIDSAIEDVEYETAQAEKEAAAADAPCIHCGAAGGHDPGCSMEEFANDVAEGA